MAAYARSLGEEFCATGDEVGLDDCASRDVQGVGGDNIVVGIVKLPPPLVSNYSHLYLVSAPQIAQSEHGIDSGTQHKEQEDGRRNRPGDFEGGIAVDLLRIRRVRAFAVAKDGIEQYSLDDDKNDCSNYQGKPEQACFSRGDRPKSI